MYELGKARDWVLLKLRWTTRIKHHNKIANITSAGPQVFILKQAEWIFLKKVKKITKKASNVE